MLVSGTLAVKLFNPDPALRVDFTSWRWMADIKIGLDHVTPPADLLTSDSRAAAPVVQPTTIQPKKIARSYGVKQPVRRIVRVAVPTPAKVAAIEVAPSLTEHERLQNVHFHLRSRLAVAWNEPAPVTTQPRAVLAERIPAPKQTLTTHRRVAAKRVVRKMEVVAAIPAAPQKPAPQPRLISSSVPKVETLQVTKASGQMMTKVVTAPMNTQPSVIRPVDRLVTDIDQLARPDISQLPNLDLLAAEVEAWIAKPTVPQAIAASAPVAPINDIPADTLTTQQAAIQPAPPAATSPAVAVEYSKVADYSNGHAAHSAAAATLPESRWVVEELKPASAPAAAPAVPSAPEFVEAFDPQTPLSFTTVDQLSREAGVNGTLIGGWQIARTSDHWPTLYWKAAGTRGTPLISYATEFLLSYWVESKRIHRGTGLVFGSVPDGWTVSISGRADAPVYLSADKQQLTGDARFNGERSFVLANVEPGGLILHLVHAREGLQTAVALPVIGGTATYIDALTIERKIFSGFVLDGAHSKARGVNGLALEILGQPAEILSASNGRFKAENVLTVGHYPIFVDTKVGGERYRHRFRVLPSAMGEQTFFVMSNQQVDTWIDQLEQGVSAKNGMVVGAVPAISKRQKQQPLYARVQSLLDRVSNGPETYPLAPHGQLLPGLPPLDPASPRFVSVQIPPGLALVRVDDRSRNLVWSELVYAESSVINVVGPY